MSCKTFNQMRHTFKNKLQIQSEWVILQRLAVLANVEPVYYDCCVNSCMAYTGRYEHHEACDFCHEPRYGKKRRSRRVFMYLPLIPRLQAMFQSKEKIGLLSYRHLFKHEPGWIRDILMAVTIALFCAATLSSMASSGLIATSPENTTLPLHSQSTDTSCFRDEDVDPLQRLSSARSSICHLRFVVTSKSYLALA